MEGFSGNVSLDEHGDENPPCIVMPTEMEIRSSIDHSPQKRLSLNVGIRTLTANEVQYLKQFIILGISPFSDAQIIVKCIDVLNQTLQRNAIDDIINIIFDISVKGKSINQDALLLTLVKCYMHDRSAVSKEILKLWRIPTHLFKSLMILRSEENEDNNTESYYKSLLTKLSTKGQIFSNNATKRQKKKQRDNAQRIGTSNGIEDTSKDNKRKGSEVKKFISKHMKLIAKWYTDPDKSAEDLLMMLMKYPSRYDWNHNQLLR